MAYSAPRDAYSELRALAERADPGGPGLTRHEARVFSQNGEDGVIAELLRRVGATTRSFAEIGCGTGAEANCVFLADVLGFSGLFVEADPGPYAVLEAKYAHTDHVRTARALAGPANVNDLLGGEERDVVSIDIDGADYWVWEALEARPRIVVVEYNASLPAARRLVQPLEAALETWDGTDYVGSSLGALRSLGEAKGYVLAHTDLTGVNAFFVRDDLAEAALDGAEVPLRGPNLVLGGLRLEPDPKRRPYLDLDDPEVPWRPPGGPEPGRRRRLRG
ncbi:MAG TPA: hypothetical protein VNT32_03500 [Thermoleophilaceae bacterium]|nr:hypothetical protein [Thermoleophilaceae bacterium]